MYTTLLVLSAHFPTRREWMTTLTPRKALQLRMWALFMFFFLPGLLMASWATRTPAIRDILSVSTAEMGIVLSVSRQMKPTKAG